MNACNHKEYTIPGFDAMHAELSNAASTDTPTPCTCWGQNR